MIFYGEYDKAGIPGLCARAVSRLPPPGQPCPGLRDRGRHLPPGPAAALSLALLRAGAGGGGGRRQRSLIFLSALLTGLGVYDRLARFGGAGTLVPITGFSNAVASPAVEFRTEGLVTGTMVKMFTIAGPVIVSGTVASALYGLVLVLLGYGG